MKRLLNLKLSALFVVVITCATFASTSDEVRLFSKSAQAQSAPAVPPERVIDRLSLALTGKLPSPELKKAFVEGKKSAADSIDELVKSDDFLQTVAKFWLAKMKITGIVDFENVKTSAGANVMQAINPDTFTMISRSLQWVNLNLSGNNQSSGAVSSGYFRLTADQESTLANVVDDEILKSRIANKSMVECSIQTRNFVRTNERICPAPYNKFDISETSTATAIEKSTCIIPAVTEPDIVSNPVSNPWFGASSTVKAFVCPGVVARCGTNLENCFPGENFRASPNGYNGPVNVMLPNLRQDFTLEPGILIASVIRDNRPWEDVLRSTEAPISGTMESFLASSFGSRIRENMPPGSYRLNNGDLVLNSARGYQDRTWIWKDRGPLHSGVLTTMSFQKSANGWRAKSAVSMEAFLCRSFVVPEGIAVLPSAETDLTRRPYCQSCHSVLEPLSLFFGRWPNVGDVNYLYDPGSNRVAAGSFEGISNADTNGLGRVYTSTQDFQNCAVSRAFEFIVGREMDQQEYVSLFPRLLSVYKTGGGRILPVFREIASSKLFSRGQQ